MRIEAVAAYAFGPFVGETLRLAPGMTVIWGRNEAGKSSWHAALYFGLCGRRRGSGQPSREERDLRARHEPWDGGRWEVGANHRTAVGPLRRATVAMERARADLQNAVAEHEAYGELRARLGELEDAEGAARARSVR